MQKIVQKTINEYAKEIANSLQNLDWEVLAGIVDVLFSAKKDGRRVFIIGNGGSASIASHMACDLNKGTVVNPADDGEKRLKVVALTDNAAHITALANDLSYEDIFVEQLKNLAEGDDVLIAISGSGNSPNIVKAVEYAKRNLIKVVGFFGFCNGGKCAGLVDYPVVVQSNHYGPIEDIHAMLGHIVTSVLRSWSQIQEKRTHAGLNSATPFAISLDVKDNSAAL